MYDNLASHGRMSGIQSYQPPPDEAFLAKTSPKRAETIRKNFPEAWVWLGYSNERFVLFESSYDRLSLHGQNVPTPKHGNVNDLFSAVRIVESSMFVMPLFSCFMPFIAKFPSSCSIVRII